MEISKQASLKASVDRDRLEGVQGKLVFARRSPDERSAPEVQVPSHRHSDWVSHSTTIRNARPIVDELSLDREGFIRIEHEISCADVRDPSIMSEKYLEEMTSFIKSHFNASWVVPRRSGVIVRRAANAAGSVRAPASVAHIDYASVAGPMLAAAENQIQKLPIRPYSRLMIIQAWRALSPPPQDFPLAFCDASTTLDADIVMDDYALNANSQNDGTAYKSTVVRFSPDQRWYYLPEMTPDELILFKGYDSERHYGRWAPHSAFDDRATYPSAKSRESIEARFFVYYA
ncbi:CmcJ/NvfI family oxidoreductase [Bradyrhizobium sp. LLZ17]|uniref:CmcJ/NvfI family oxidoreductase n=1 Tax=Bradyrhizobium sp. LLZ17 TaxID=3239388 RepID=A0AB39XUL8_9BRAD